MGLFILEKAPGKPPSNLPVPKGGCKRPEEGLFTMACRDRKPENCFRMKIIRFQLDVRKKFFSAKVLRHWHSLLREVVNTPCLDESYT